jgi:RNA polymerase sigma-70 factor, ECF subfamily
MKSAERQPESSQEPMHRIAGDPEAFVQLYRRTYDDIFRYCVHRLFERHAAEDVTSEVFLKAAMHVHRFSGCEESQFRNWLFRIATNEVNNHLRKTNRRRILLRRLGRGPDPNGEDHEPPDTQQIERVKTALLRLRPRHQAIITLRFFENLKPMEIAEVLGCSAATVRSCVARAIAQLRRHFKAAGVESPAGGEPDE